LEDRHKLLKGVIFRLVEKYIAGSTMVSALDYVREVNGKGMRATVTFLNEGVADAARARYNANTYIQLARQATRLHLNADISLRLSQMGAGINSETAERNIKSVLEAATGNGVGIWLEAERDTPMEELFHRYRAIRKGARNAGMEIPVWYPLEVSTIKKNLKKGDKVKLTTYSYVEIDEMGAYEGNGTAKGKSEAAKVQKRIEQDALDQYIGKIGRLLQEGVAVTVLEHNQTIMTKMASFSREYKKNLIFELPLGYNRSGLGKLIKMKVNLSVYVPYGKDWTRYVVNKLTLGHGKIRSIAARILDVSSMNEDSHAEK
jgi:proline dehydrogenase